MRIAVNTRFLIKDKMEGFGWFTYETMRRITTTHPEHEFIFIFDRPYDESFVFSNNVTPVVVGPQARHPVLFKIWFNNSIRSVLKKQQADVFVSPDGYLCLKTDVPQLSVIHDLNFEHFPEDLPKSASNYLRKYFPLFAKKATRIATVSNYSKKDIVRQYGIDTDKIDVVYNGVGEHFTPVLTDLQVTVRKVHTDDQPYFVYVGSLHPRKNISRLLLAFEEFRKESEPCKLVIVGERYWWNKDMEEVYQGLKHKDEVVFLGHLHKDELNNIIGSALAMTYISYFEGFGIPALEAMKCEVPLIAANATSLPEVVGDAGLMVDPYSVEEITEAMARIYKDESLRNELIEKGRERVKQFNWDNTAEGLWQSIERTVGTN